MHKAILHKAFGFAFELTDKALGLLEVAYGFATGRGNDALGLVRGTYVAFKKAVHDAIEAL